MSDEDPMPEEWDNLLMNRKLTKDEISSLRQELRPLLVSTAGADEEDVNDFLEYTTAMISNQKAVSYAVKELQAMEMDFCPKAVSIKIGHFIQSYVEKKLAEEATSATKGDEAISSQPNDGGTPQSKNRVVSLKSSSGGNALAMAGALGASREGKRKDAQQNKQQDRKKNDSPNKKDNGNNKRRDIRGEAFDRLARQDKNPKAERGEGGRGRRNDDDRSARGGRGRGGQDDRRGGRGRGGRLESREGEDDRGRGRGQSRGGPNADNRGHRRNRDEYAEEQPRPAGRGGGRDSFRGGRGGRGPRGGPGGRSAQPSRGRGGDNSDDRDNKRQRMEHQGGGPGGDPYEQEYYDDQNYQGEGYNNYHNDQYMQDDSFHGYGGYDQGYGRGYPARGYGRGFRGGHRGGRGRGFRGGWGGYQHHPGRGAPAGAAEDNQTKPQGDSSGQTAAEGGDNAVTSTDTAEAAAVHPSPIVAAAFRGGYRGGFRGGGRGRGRWNSGRGDVKSMIASKTWVRKKDGEGEGGDNSNQATDAAAGAPSEG